MMMILDVRLHQIGRELYNHANTDTGDAVCAHAGVVLQSDGTLTGLAGASAVAAAAEWMCVTDEVSSPMVAAVRGVLTAAACSAVPTSNGRLTAGFAGGGERAVHKPWATQSQAYTGMAQAAMQPNTHAPTAAAIAAPIIIQLSTTPGYYRARGCVV